MVAFECLGTINLSRIVKFASCLIIELLVPMGAYWLLVQMISK